MIYLEILIGGIFDIIDRLEVGAVHVSSMRESAGGFSIDAWSEELLSRVPCDVNGRVTRREWLQVPKEDLSILTLTLTLTLTLIYRFSRKSW